MPERGPYDWSGWGGEVAGFHQARFEGRAADPVAMAAAFRQGVEAGRAAFEAGLMEARDFASPSTPVVGTPFWHAVS